MEEKVTRDQFFVFVGTSGTGKTTLIENLKSLGYEVREEAVRNILCEKVSEDGVGFKPDESRLFLEKMLQRMKVDYHVVTKTKQPVFFDRGLPDLVAYAARFNLDTKPFFDVAGKLRYNQKCFVFPPWRDIFVQDEFRGMNFEFYQDFHESILKVYRELNYELVYLPLDSVANRTRFIEDYIRSEL